MVNHDCKNPSVIKQSLVMFTAQSLHLWIFYMWPHLLSNEQCAQLTYWNKTFNYILALLNTHACILTANEKKHKVLTH